MRQAGAGTRGGVLLLITAVLVAVGAGPQAFAAPLASAPHATPLASVPASLAAAKGLVTVAVEFAPPSTVEVAGRNGLGVHRVVDAARQKAAFAAANKAQEAFLPRLAGIKATALARLHAGLDAVVVRIDASRLTALAAQPGVTALATVPDGQLQAEPTGERPEAIGPENATAGVEIAHAEGYTGTGIVLADLDTGVDYTHSELGGPGTTAAYQAAFGTSVSDPLNTTTDGLFPTAKVIGGYDFVGDTTVADGPLHPDPDPIDAPYTSTDIAHGTHTADDAVGVNGVAPGAKLLAYKVCLTTVDTCSGTAILEGYDRALDPNNDGNSSDAANVINYSIGTTYASDASAISQEQQHAVDAGVVVVAAAGNAGDHPYVTGDAGAGLITVGATTSTGQGIASFSSRGPNLAGNRIKPDLSAVGIDSASAASSTGTGTSSVQGTSFSTPRVSGAAALLLQQDPTRTPLDIKALLGNSADVLTGTPVTRQGDGALRVDQALALHTEAYDAAAQAVNLSFGFQPLAAPATVTRTVTVRNTSPQTQTYVVTSAFRSTGTASDGAYALAAPPSVVVTGNSTATFPVSLTITPALLGTVPSDDAGLDSGNSAQLNAEEADGYVTLTSAADAVHLGFEVAAHASSSVSPASSSVVLDPSGQAQDPLTDTSSVFAGSVSAFTLLGTGPRTDPVVAGDTAPDIRAFGVRQVSCPQGLCLQFAVTGYGTRAHPAQAQVDIDLDLDDDGVTDDILFDSDITGDTSHYAFLYNVTTKQDTAQAPVTATLNSSNIVETVAESALGITATSSITATALGIPYATGATVSTVGPVTFTAGTPRYTATTSTIAVPAGGVTRLTISSVAGGDTASPGETGILLLEANEAGRTTDDTTEADIITVGSGAAPALPDVPYPVVVPALAVLAAGLEVLRRRRRAGA